MAFLELNNIYKQFANAPTAAVDNFNLQIEKGEFVSFLGPSGCGKTTTLRMVAGFETPTSGQIIMGGQEITQLRPNQRSIGMVFQSYALFPNMSVADNIGFGLKVAGKPVAEIKQRVSEMLSLIKLEQLSGRYPYQMSGGQQQRVALARALAIRPQLLLLDEPLSALDAKIRVSLRNEIRAIQRQLGITTIYVTHDQEEALSLSDRVVVMSNGKMEQVGTPFEIYNFPKTSFVASFVGTLNLLKAQVVDGGQGIVEVNGQKLRVGEAVSGTSTQVALRPEQVRLTRTASTENELPAIVETINFLGSVVRLDLRVGEQKLSLDEFNGPYLVLPKIGEKVTVYFPPEVCLVMAA